MSDIETVWCACGDGHKANSYGAGFMAANNGVCDNCDAAAGNQPAGFTAVDMGTASADGFRDGIAKLNAAYLAGWSASGQGWNGEHPCGACERETWAKDRDADIQKIIAADVSKEG